MHYKCPNCNTEFDLDDIQTWNTPCPNCKNTVTWLMIHDEGECEPDKL